GLSWIDPAEVPRLLIPQPTGDERPALAWRWTGIEARAQVERVRALPDTKASIDTLARVAEDGGNLYVEGIVRVRTGSQPIESIPLWIGGQIDALEGWRFQIDDGLELALRPIRESTRSQLGIPPEGSARDLAIAMPGLATKTIQFQARQPFRARGLVP